MAGERKSAKADRIIDIDDILRRGLNALSDAIDDLAKTKREMRDERWHYRNLASCVEAAAHVQREQREQSQWLAEQELDAATLRTMLAKYLGSMPLSEAESLIREARAS